MGLYGQLPNFLGSHSLKRLTTDTKYTEDELRFIQTKRVGSYALYQARACWELF
jgi:hypothetical protein